MQPQNNYKREAVVALNGSILAKVEKYQNLFAYKKLTFIAADGGALFLNKINIVPDVIIGDMDSLTTAQIENFKNKEVDIIKYPVQKDETDGELALNYCIENEFQKVFLIGSQGGRFDQQLANIFLLEYGFENNISAVIKEPGLEAGIINDYHIFNQLQEHRLSLLPLSREVKGVTIKGCKYNVSDIDLLRYKTRGISNKILQNNAEVKIKKGLLLYIIN